MFEEYTFKMTTSGVNELTHWAVSWFGLSHSALQDNHKYSKYNPDDIVEFKYITIAV